MPSVILVMWPNVEDLLDEFEGQGIGLPRAAVFPGSKKAALRSRLYQERESSDLTVVEITGIGSSKIGMTSMPTDVGDVIKDAFPNAGNFFS